MGQKWKPSSCFLLQWFGPRPKSSSSIGTASADLQKKEIFVSTTEILDHHEKTMDLKIKTVIFIILMMTSSVLTIPDSVTTSHRGLIPILKTKLPPDSEYIICNSNDNDFWLLKPFLPDLKTYLPSCEWEKWGYPNVKLSYIYWNMLK